jgi:hypothetical protein
MVASSGQRILAGRRAFVAGAACTLVARALFAEGPNVPIRLQAEFLAKIAGYDRHFAERAGDRARVLIAVVPRDSDSRLAATDMRNALAALPSVGGIPHEEEIIQFADAASLAEICRSRRAAVLYLTPGLLHDMPAIRDALAALDLLTVASLADYVPAGAVLGFDLVSGRPKLLVNLTQARKQHVDFRAEVLKLTRVFE